MSERLNRGRRRRLAATVKQRQVKRAKPAKPKRRKSGGR